MAGKFFVWALVVGIFRQGWQTAILAATGLTQIGEFSFILVRVARQAELVGDDVYQATLATSLFTILLNAWLVRYVPRFMPHFLRGQINALPSS
jgi:CPA2 family monovalent cation:H+ antiporter-2